MAEDGQQYTFDRLVRTLLALGAVVVVFVLVRHLSDVLVPFAAAAILAYLLNPLVSTIERRTKGRRGSAVAITLVGLGAVGVVGMLILVPLMGHQLGRFERSLTQLRDDLPASLRAGVVETQPAGGSDAATTGPADESMGLGLRELLEGLEEYRQTRGELVRSERIGRLYEKVSGTLAGVVLEHAATFVGTEQFRTFLLVALKRLAVGGLTVINFAVELVLGATVLIVVLIYLVFLLVDFNEYARASKALLPPKYRDAVLEFAGEFEVAMRRYFRGQFIVAILVGILFSVGFSIIGLPMAVPLGLFIGVLNMVPYLQIVALVPAGVLALLRTIEQGSSVLVSFGLVLMIFAVVQVLQDAVIVPRVMGKATGLRPVSILLGVFIWGKLLGFFGLLLAIPLTCLGIAYYRRYVLTHPLAVSESSIQRT